MFEEYTLRDKPPDLISIRLHETDNAHYLEALIRLVSRIEAEDDRQVEN